MKKSEDKNTEKKLPLKLIIASAGGVLFIALIVLFLVFFVFVPHKMCPEERPAKFAPVAHASKGTLYTVPESLSEGALIAYMYDSGVSDKLFSEFFDTDTYMAPDTVSSIRVFAHYLGDIEASYGDDFPTYILLGIDPYAAFVQSCSNKETYMENLSFIRQICERHPYSMFMVQFPDDDASKWNALEGSALDDARISYITPVREFYDIINVRFIYHSVDEWVLYPECIRGGENEDHLVTEVADGLLAYDILSLDRTLRADTVNGVMDEVVKNASDYEGIFASYPDMKDKKVFFVGDSVFGNYRKETAISSFFAEMTGARVYNLGQGGVSAVAVSDPETPVGNAFSYLVGKNDVKSFDEAFSSFESHASYRLAASDLEGSAGEDCIFIVELGLNDYLNAESVSDYENAMEQITASLKSAYPKAQIVVLAPGYVGKYDFGWFIMGDGGSVLSEYRDAALSVCEDSGIPCISLTDIPGFNQDDWEDFILLDGIHYNENGRYSIAKYLAAYFKNSKV